MKNILLIGGEGYIGNIVSQKLLANDFKVTSYDNLLYKNHNCVLNKAFAENYVFIVGDILNTDQLTNLIKRFPKFILG